MNKTQNEQTKPKKGKWAMAAEQIAKDNFLGEGLGEKLEKNVKMFRENFVMRDLFSKDKE